MWKWNFYKCPGTFFAECISVYNGIIPGGGGKCTLYTFMSCHSQAVPQILHPKHWLGVFIKISNVLKCKKQMYR